MSTKHVRDLAAALKTNIGGGDISRDFWGKVTAINAGSPLTVSVTVNGAPTTSAISCRYSAGYAVNTPTVGDVVFGRHDGGSDFWVVDKLA